MMCLRSVVHFITLFASVWIASGGSTLRPIINQEGIKSEFLPVPSMKGVPSDTFKKIGIDKYFSLWDIYITASNFTDQPWTIFAPLNDGLPEDVAFVSKEEFTRESLLNHLVIGDTIDVDAAESKGKQFYSYSESVLVFTKGRGHSFVNGIRLTGDKITFGQGVIYAIQKSIPLSEPEFIQFVPFAGLTPLHSGRSTKENTEIIAEALEPLEVERTSKFSSIKSNHSHPVSTTSKSSIDLHRESVNLFSTTVKSSSDIEKTDDVSEIVEKNISAPTKKLSIFDTFSIPKIESESFAFLSNDESSKLEPITSARELFEEADILITDPSGQGLGDDAPVEEFAEFFEEKVDASNSNFVSSMLNALDVSSSNGREFAHHFKKSNLSQFLSPDKNYTGIIATNDAFYDYYPIDWGFNPFLVDNFTRDVLLNHLLEGNIDLQSFDDHVQIQTMEGRIIQVSKDREGTLLVNGNIVPKETEVQVPHGRLYFVHRLLFVDYDRVFDLRREYPFLETAPLLSFPWPSAPFLSHLLKRLQEMQRSRFFAHLLRNSHISQNVSSNDEDFNRLSYTAFVPKDDALKANLTFAALDEVSQDVADNFLLNHIVEGYLFEKDFKDGQKLRSLTGKDIPITIANRKIFVGSSTIVQPQSFIYNLGTVFIIDKPLYDLDNEERIIVSRKEESNPFVDLISSTSELHQVVGRTKSQTSQHLTSDSSAPLILPSPTKKIESPYSVRTEVSYSRQIGDGPNVPITKEQMEKELRL